LYDEVAVLDDVVGAGDVVVTFDPLAVVSDVVVEPSLLVTDLVEAPLVLLVPSAPASICENRSCSALPDAAAVVPVDDWLCASSSAPKVVGDICPPPLNPVTAAEFPEAEAPPDRPNKSAEAWLKPVDWADDELEEVSDLIAFSAADAAPRASSMAELRQMPQSAALLQSNDEQTPCHCEKPSQMRVLRIHRSPGPPGNWCRRGRIFRLAPGICPQASRVLRGNHL
jgi:hypothetical protein